MSLFNPSDFSGYEMFAVLRAYVVLRFYAKFCRETQGSGPAFWRLLTVAGIGLGAAYFGAFVWIEGFKLSRGWLGAQCGVWAIGLWYSFGRAMGPFFQPKH